MTAPLYTASVPVLLHYLDRAAHLVRLTRSRPGLLSERLAPDMFTAAEQVATAAGFALRAAFPVAGKDVPEFEALGMDYDGLIARIGFARAQLDGLAAADFDGAEARIVTHRAGFAELEQPAADYLHRFAMPNFLFHLSMAFAILRQNGVEIGKSDFDALHDYPQGFRF